MAGELFGQTLGNRYHFEKLLGEGTFAHVYRITDRHRRATLAAKVLRRDIAQNPTFLARFQREATLLARLQHPNIVRYYDIVETDHTIFILMDYIPGTTLETVLRNAAEPIKPYTSLTYLTPLAAALHFAHNEEVIHRDLKPANILLHENGTLYVTDFGIARLLNVTSDLTAGITIGTPFYMAPEQITGEPVTVATDVYSLGIILYRMYTGLLPFRGERPGTEGDTTATRITREQVHAKPEPLRYLNATLDLAIEEIVLRCLEKNPARRFRSVSELYDALAEAVGAPPISLESAPVESIPPEALVKPLDMKLPEWSQYMPQIEGQSPETHSDEEETLPPTSAPDEAPKTVEKIERPVPQPITKPHLEDQLHPSSSDRTIPALGRQPSPPPPARPISPPAYHTEPDYMPPTRNWTLIMGVIGTLLVISTLCIAAIYLTQYSGSDVNNSDINSDLTLTVVTRPTGTATISTTQEQAGSHIAFDSRRNGNFDIYIMNIDGTGLRQLAGSSGSERGPAWSPDGTRIAFYGGANENSNGDIYVINVDGTGLQNLTNSPNADDKYPTWSPDGTQLAFHSNADGDYDLYVINVNGTGLHAVTNNTVDDLGPDWSPEGTQIVFHTAAWGEPYEIAILDLTTSNVRRLTNNNNTNAFPTWSPDGARIAYHSFNDSGAVNIYVLRTDGSPAQTITNTIGYNAFPDWSPNGAHIIYHSGSNYESAILMIPSSGGTPERLTGTQANYLPEWEPNR